MKLIKKSETSNLLSAISKVSEYSESELQNARSRDIMPWVKLGMFIAREHCGHTYEGAASLFNKHFSSCYAAISKVKMTLDECEDTINQMLEVKKELDSKGSLQECSWFLQ